MITRSGPRDRAPASVHDRCTLPRCWVHRAAPRLRVCSGRVDHAQLGVPGCASLPPPCLQRIATRGGEGRRGKRRSGIGGTRRGGRFRVRHEHQLHERSGKLRWLRHSLLHRRVHARRLLLRRRGPHLLRDRPTWSRRLLLSERAGRSRDRPVPLWRLQHRLPSWDDVLERDVRRRRRRRRLSVTRGPID